MRNLSIFIAKIIVKKDHSRIINEPMTKQVKDADFLASDAPILKLLAKIENLDQILM